jgi:hypothetical protein
MTEKYPIGIAGPDLNQISRDYTHLVATHERFALASLHNSWRAFQEAAKDTEPALLIVFADIAPSPDALKEVLSTLKRAIVILLLPPNWAQFQGVFEKLDKVRKLYILPAAPKEVLAYGLTLIETEIARNRTVAPLQSPRRSGRASLPSSRRKAVPAAQPWPKPWASNWPPGATSALCFSPLTCLPQPPCAWGRASRRLPPSTCSALRAASRMRFSPLRTGWM